MVSIHDDWQTIQTYLRDNTGVILFFTLFINTHKKSNICIYIMHLLQSIKTAHSDIAVCANMVYH